MSISTRVLRKFQGDRDIISGNAEDGSDVEEAPFAGGVRKKQLNVNRYDLLNQHSQSESEVKEDDDDNDQESRGAHTSHCDNRESTRRKKKKKRKKASHSNQRQSSDDVDEIERSVREVNAILGDSVPRQARAKDSALNTVGKKGILSVEHKHLNPKNELKRIFGSKTIQTEQNKRRARGRGNIKNAWLVTPKEQWPPITKLGLSMKLLETKEGVQYFTYEHSIVYQNIQKKFLDAVDSLDPENIVAIANEHPYHVDTMIQLSDICKLSEDLATAAELIERALYSLESAFHPLFNIAKGNCRLDYRRQENRSLYITLFKHLMFVGQRACYRTALEFCKLILSLEPDEDPLAIVLAIDFYALRAREFTWLLELVSETEHRRNLSQLPNMAFSKAVALFQLSDSSADASLQDALLMFPGVLLPLLDKCGVQSDPKTQSHSYFQSATSSQSPALKQLVLLYVNRCYHIWKEPETLAWLEKNTLEVLRRVDDKDPLVADYAQKRSRRYEARSPKPVDRHMYLSDIKEVTAILAENTSVSTTFSFDPLPPLDTINLYPRTERTHRMYQHSNAVTLFFRSLMPNFDGEPAQPRNADVREGHEAEDVAAGHAYLQHSVTNLLDAMRNLLSNLQPDAHEQIEDEDDILSDTPTDSDDDDEDDELPI